MPLFHPPAARVGRRRGAALGLLLGALTWPSALAAQTCIDCVEDPPPPPGAVHSLDLRPHNDVHHSAALCMSDCFDAAVSYTSPVYVSLDTERSVTLLFRNAQARPRGLVQVDVSDVSGRTPTRLSLRLRRADGTWVSFTTGTEEIFYAQNTTATSRLAAQFEASGLATGAHTYTLVVRSWYSDGTMGETSTPIRVLILNERNSPLGLGWSIPGLQRIHPQTGGAVVLTEGDGSILYFGPRPCSSCAYVQPPGDFTTLTFDGTTYRRRYPDGTEAVFASSGRLSYVQERYGSTTRTSYGYDTAGRLSTITDPAGKRITFGYDSTWGLLWIRDPGGRQVNTNVSNGVLFQFYEPDGVLGLDLAFWYDRLDGYWTRGVPRSQGDSMRWHFDYDHAQRLAAVTAPTVNINGQPGRPVTRFTSLEAAVLAAPGTGSFANPASRVSATAVRARITTPRGHVTSLALDRFGAPTRIEEPLGRTTVLTRNSNSQVTQSLSPSNNRVDYRWQGANLILRSDQGAQHADTMVYDPTYNRLQERSRRAHPVSGSAFYYQRVRYHYRGVYLDSVTIGPGTGTRYMTYTMDTRGRVTATTDAAGNITRSYPASSGWMNTDSVVAPGRRKTTYTSDGYGRVRTVQNPLSQTDTLQYDLLNRITRTAQPERVLTTYGYTGAHLTSVTDARGQVYRFAPNALGWVETETDPLGRQDRYLYDANGNQTRWTNRRNQSVDFTYDELDNLRTRTADREITQYYTDPQGRFTSAHVPRVSTDTIRFDVAGRVSHQISVHGGRRHVLESSYSFLGPRTQLKMTAPWTRTIAYNYDAHFNQLEKLWDVSGGGTTVGYDARRLATSYALPTGNTISIRYPSTNQPALVRHSVSALNSPVGVQYLQDKLVRSVERSNAAGDSIRQFGYDNLGQLTSYRDWRQTYQGGECTWDPNDGIVCSDPSATRTLLAQQSYTYDAVGNRTDRGASVQTGNRLTGFDGYTLTYDEDGNLTRKYKAGVIDQYFSWNSLGELTSVTTNGNTVQYRYNGWGELVTRTGAGYTHRYIYDGDNLFMETVDGWPEPAREFTYYPGVDRPHSMRQWSPFGCCPPATYYFATDYPGNVLGLFNASNQLVSRYRYDPWGNFELQSDGPALSVLHFAGRYRDWDTGLYYNRSRWYDSHTGRFISEDPIGLAGGINLYAYAANNPVDLTDPFGLCPTPNGGWTMDGRCTFVVIIPRGGFGPPGWAGAVVGFFVQWQLANLAARDQAAALARSQGQHSFYHDGAFCDAGVSLIDGSVGAPMCFGVPIAGMTAAGGKITGYAIDRAGLRHALHRSIGRDGHGVSPRAILDAVNNPTKIVQQAHGRVMYVGQHAKVVLDSTGKMVTTWATKRQGWRF